MGFEGDPLEETSDYLPERSALHGVGGARLEQARVVVRVRIVFEPVAHAANLCQEPDELCAEQTA